MAFRIRVLCAGLLGIGCGLAFLDAGAEESDSASLWTGVSAGPKSIYGWFGAGYAFSGDIDAEGVVARIGMGGGQYRTEGSNPQDVPNYGVDVMLGYRLRWQESVVTLHAGGDYIRHDNGDLAAAIRGAQFGAKALAEIYAPFGESFYASAFGQYSTAFDTFNASAKLAYRLSDRLSLGPEAAALGSQGFDQTRTGLAAAYWITDGTELAVSAGYAWSMTDSDGGPYGMINLYTRF